jgi:hypothetical protein
MPLEIIRPASCLQRRCRIDKVGEAKRRRYDSHFVNLFPDTKGANDIASRMGGIQAIRSQQQKCGIAYVSIQDGQGGESGVVP